jgi:hypothetical protein
MPGKLSGAPWEQVSHEADLAIRKAWEALYGLRARVEEVASKPQPVNIRQIRAALQASGSAPINITQLLGADSLAAIDQDTHANRPDAGTAVFGKPFWETDRTVLYIVGTVGGANAWVYVAGEFLVTQPNLPVDLGAGDVGFIAAVLTDFNHRLRWSGTAWEFAPGDSGGRYIAGFVGTPPGGGWQICDGTATTFLNATGTTTAFTTPNLSAHYLKFAGAYTATAVAGGLTTSVSAGTPAGTNSAPTFTGSGGSTGGPTSTTVVASGTGATVASSGHAHGFTPAGTVSAPAFTGSALAGHDHGPNTLELARTELIPYFRR